MAIVEIPQAGLWGGIADDINANFDEAGAHEAHFIAVSSDTVPISTDSNALTVITGLSILASNNGFVVDAPTGSVINTGRSITAPVGTVSFQPDRTGGGQANSIYIVSERSPDGLVWTKNLNSIRKVEVANDGESFKTAVSYTDSWATGEYLRFKFYTVGGGAISFTPSSETLEGTALIGYSFIWTFGG